MKTGKCELTRLYATLLSIVMLCLGVSVAWGGFWDGLKQKAGEVKEKWQESERRCVDCGKVIHGRDRCTTCEAKRAAEATRNAAERAREETERIKKKAEETKQEVKRKWEESERRCVDCGHVVHGRDRCTTCEAKRASEQVRKAADQVSKGARDLKQSWDANKDQWKEQARTKLEESAQKLQEIANDPEKQRRLIGQAIAMKRDLELTAIRACPVVDPDTQEIVPLDRLMRKMARDSGIGGSMGEDPIGTAYMMMIDSDYLFSSARLVPNPSGEYVTLNEALLASRSIPGLYDQTSLEQASDSYRRIQSAMRSNDGASMSSASRDFGEAVATLRGGTPPSSNSPISAGRWSGVEASGREVHAVSAHLAAWARVDTVLAATISFFEDSHRWLSKSYRRMGLESSETIAWLATGTIILGVLLLLLILRALARAGLKSRLKTAQRELEELRGSQRSSRVRARTED